MLGSSRYIALAVSVVLLLVAVWLVLSEPAPLEAPLSTEGAVGVPALTRAEVDMAHGQAGPISERVNAVSLGSSEGRSIAPERAWRLLIFGRVVSASDETVSIADAEIDLLLSDGGQPTLTIPKVTSDDSGAFSVEVMLGREWFDPEGEKLYVEVHGSIWAPGYSLDTFVMELDLAETNEAQLDLELAPGADVTGYIFDSSGEPVSADIYLQEEGGDRSHSTSADDNGFYRFDEVRDGFASVRARSDSGGTAFVERVVIDSQVRTRITDLYLAGSGSLGGVLVDPNGEPIAAHAVSLLAEELVANAESGPDQWNYTLGDAPTNLGAERGDGALFGNQLTATDGSFLFEGLRPGRYMLLARYRSEGKVLSRTQAMFTTGELAVRLVLGAYRLVVSLEGGSEHPVHCTEIHSKGAHAFGMDPPPSIPRLRRNPATFAVQPERSYRVGVDSESQDGIVFAFGTTPGPWEVPSCEQNVEIEEGQYLTRVLLDPAREGGRMLIQVQDDVGENAYRVRIESLSLGRIVRLGNVAAVELPLRIKIAPGEYRVHVGRYGGGSSGFFNDFGEPTYANRDERFHVDSGWQETTVMLGDESHLLFRFGLGGRLRVATPPGRIRSHGFTRFGGVSSSMHFNFKTTQVFEEFELENETGERTHSLSFSPSAEQSSGGSGSGKRNWRDLSQALSVGRYTIRWRDGENEVHEKRFEIRARETTSVVFDSE